MPSLSPFAAHKALEWVARLANELEAKPELVDLNKHQLAHLDKLKRGIARFGLAGSNRIRFVRAAHEAGIPTTHLPGGVIQFGWGKRGRLFVSSITDKTSAIAGQQTKKKNLTSATLRVAGLPVLEFQMVRDAEQAVEIAERLGFPVVVKPSDRDQGLGVTTDLRDSQAVRRACEEPAKASKNVMVEKHLAGKCLRIHVYQWKWWTIAERVAAGVTGDGVSSVRRLVDQVNVERLRRMHAGATHMKPVEIDGEASEMLTEVWLTVDSIPEKDRRVALRRAANVSTGGEMIKVTDPIHPDNIALAERACSILRLDVGVCT